MANFNIFIEIEGENGVTKRAVLVDKPNFRSAINSVKNKVEKKYPNRKVTIERDEDDDYEDSIVVVN